MRDGQSYSAEDRYKYVHKLFKKALFVVHVRTQEHGLEDLPHKPMLFICNHKSQIDPIVLMKLMYESPNLTFYSFVAKRELVKRKIISRVMDLMDTIYLDRANLRQVYEVYESQKKAINQGRSVVVFIEGTRIYEDKMGEFKSAVLKVAYKCLVPIAPIVLYGTSGLIDSNKSNIDRRKRVYVKALPIIKPNDFMTTHEDYIAEKLKLQMQATYDEMKQQVLDKKVVFPKE
jgi:1-acyl-sn-glycerol-3-phosphate acyltransferase